MAALHERDSTLLVTLVGIAGLVVLVKMAGAELLAIKHCGGTSQQRYMRGPRGYDLLLNPCVGLRTSKPSL
jgi:hypothetical protein